MPTLVPPPAPLQVRPPTPPKPTHAAPARGMTAAAPVAKPEPVPYPDVPPPPQAAKTIEELDPIPEPPSVATLAPAAMPVLSEVPSVAEPPAPQVVPAAVPVAAPAPQAEPLPPVPRPAAHAEPVAESAPSADQVASPSMTATLTPDPDFWGTDEDIEPAGDKADDAVTSKPGRKRMTKRRIRDLVILLVAVALMISGVVIAVFAYRSSNPPGGFTDLQGNHVVPDDASAVDPVFQQKADAKDDLGVRFKIPSVNLNVPLGEVNEVDGVINPPGFSSVYRLRNLGVTLKNAEQGTVYTATHSLRPPGVGPGNYVINVASGTVIVPVGGEIDVGDRVYSMVSYRIINKGDLGAQQDLWANTPGMLVFITCLQFPTAAGYQADGHSSENVIIVGKLVR